MRGKKFLVLGLLMGIGIGFSLQNTANTEEAYINRLFASLMCFGEGSSSSGRTHGYGPRGHDYEFSSSWDSDLGVCQRSVRIIRDPIIWGPLPDASQKNVTIQ